MGTFFSSDPRAPALHMQLNSVDWYQRVATRSAQGFARHHGVITGAVMVSLAGFAVTAFGIAPMAPDAAALPQRVVTEIVGTPDLAPQFEALAAQELELVRNEITRPGDTADSLLRRLGVHDPVAAEYLRRDPIARQVLTGKGGKMVQALADARGNLLELTARSPSERIEAADTHFTRLTMKRIDARWLAMIETVPLTPQVRLGSGSIRTSLFAATDDAGLPDNIASQLTEMFAGEVDFHREIRRGDRFSVVYEALTADGEPVTWNDNAGRILAAEFTRGTKTYSALWYRNASGKGAYFDFNGRSKRRAFLASPLEFSRVTSGFAMRLHPVLQTWRQHLGVDYAAPSGTPVRSVADGVVSFAGWQSGYGNVVKVTHGGDRETTYAHLSAINVKLGQRVEQNQGLGAVGATGWATGPHLHFEFRVKGAVQDPLTLGLAAETFALDADSSAEFAALAPVVRTQLEAARSIGARQVE